MTSMTHDSNRSTRTAAAAKPGDLRNYYLLRAGVATGWVAAAFTAGKASPGVGAALLIAYPAWDAVANLIDASRNGGLARNPTQALNLMVSAATTAAVAVKIDDIHAVIGIFGLWAIFAGLLQLATGIRRWKIYGAQWAMILSGAQSAFAGGHFIQRSLAAPLPHVTDVAPYAAFGAFYFLISALWLTFHRTRSAS